MKTNIRAIMAERGIPSRLQEMSMPNTVATAYPVKNAFPASGKKSIMLSYQT
jgi:hypothetical protein